MIVKTGNFISDFCLEKKIRLLKGGFESHLPNLDRYLKKLICIPNGWWVTPDERKYIVDTIRQFT